MIDFPGAGLSRSAPTGRSVKSIPNPPRGAPRQKKTGLSIKTMSGREPDQHAGPRRNPGQRRQPVAVALTREAPSFVGWHCAANFNIAGLTGRRRTWLRTSHTIEQNDRC